MTQLPPDQVERMVAKGLTDLDLADVFGVSIQRIKDLKAKDKAFLRAYLEGQDAADATVAQSLYQRAIGYSHPEEKVFCNADGAVTKVTVTKRYPPDAIACFFWLKNRRPLEWADRPKVDELGNAEITIIVNELRRDDGKQVDE